MVSWRSSPISLFRPEAVLPSWHLDKIQRDSRDMNPGWLDQKWFAILPYNMSVFHTWNTDVAQVFCRNQASY